MEPQPLCQLLAHLCNNVPVGRCSVITKGTTCVENPQVTLDAGMHRNKEESIFHMPERSTNVIVHEKYFLKRVGNPKVPNPNH